MKRILLIVTAVIGLASAAFAATAIVKSSQLDCAGPECLATAQPPADARAETGHAPILSIPMEKSRAAQPMAQSCGGCTDACASESQACNNGSMKSCYLAAACLCQCNLDAGGCGSSKDALQQCADDNRRSAQGM